MVLDSLNSLIHWLFFAKQVKLRLKMASRSIRQNWVKLVGGLDRSKRKNGSKRSQGSGRNGGEGHAAARLVKKFRHHE